MFNIKLLTNINDVQQNYAVYQIHHETTFEVLFVGIVKLTNLFQMPDFYQNPIMKQYVKSDENFHVSVEAVCDGKGAALKKQSELIRLAGWPDANKFAKVAANGTVTCNETGAEFQTVKAAAEAYGLDPAAVSRNIRNLPGHVSVKGYSFTRK